MEYFGNFGKKFAKWANYVFQGFRVVECQAAFREVASAKSAFSSLSCLFNCRNPIIFFESSSQRRELIDLRLLHRVMAVTS
jgi:hypothetical protein